MLDGDTVTSITQSVIIIIIVLFLIFLTTVKSLKCEIYKQKLGNSLIYNL